MNTNSMLVILLILLVGAMYYWITATGGERIIAMLALTILSYWVGRIQGVKIGRSENGIQTKTE